MMYQFANHNSFTVQLPGPDGKMVTFARGQKIMLSEFFRRYVPKHLTLIKTVSDGRNVIMPSRQYTPPQPVAPDKKPASKVVAHHVVRPSVPARVVERKEQPAKVVNKIAMGRTSMAGRQATEFSVARVNENAITISNNVGVGILSFNRLPALTHLIASIRKYTDLTRTTVFVSDESTDSAVWDWLKDQKDIVAFHSDSRLGVAGNTNRLLRCLERFKHKLVLNDDVEVLKEGWDDFYFAAMVRTNYKHFCYRQVGVYNAKRPEPRAGILTVHEKPHGAVMAIHHDVFKKVGFFDEQFGLYGLEHVDYSDRIAKTGMQPPGYHDVVESDLFFKIHNDQTSDGNKGTHFAKARQHYESVKHNSTRIFVGTTDRTAVKSATYIVPFRNIGRGPCLNTVIASIRAQKYPVIQIILSEQDISSQTNPDDVGPVDYIFTPNWKPDMHFCKSAAFNRGVCKAKYEDLILHDADMLAQSDYTKIVCDLLAQNEAAHIGKTVCYMDQKATDTITTAFKVNASTISSERIVSYYEGGSFGIKKSAYFRIGGFIEDFIGYGCEDTEFFKRMKDATKLYNERFIDLFHLWHGRTPGWDRCHDANKALQARIFATDLNAVIAKYAAALKQRCE